MRSSIVTIDGPSASGKSTVARRLAARLKAIYVDSGSLYRTVTWKGLQEGVDPADSRQVADLLRRLRIEGVVEGGCVRFRINGEDPGAQIRSEAVSERVSEFSAVAAVRGEVVRRLRETAALGRIVMEGRDIGSVVLPEAGFKFYLDADPEERARRRQSEMAERKETATVARVLDSLKRRDAKDAGRELAPLTIPKGAEVVDTTRMTIDEVVDRLFRRITG